MQYSKEYVQALEDLITDKLLPVYIESCRRKGLDPNTTQIVQELVAILKKKQTKIPALLRASEK